MGGGNITIQGTGVCLPNYTIMVRPRGTLARALYNKYKSDEHLLTLDRNEEREMDKETGAVARASKMEDDIEKTEMERRIRLLHVYNTVKDTTQHLIGSLASLQRVTSKEIHERLSLQ